MRRIGAIIQARFSATRFPGKVLKQLPYGSGITVLEQVIRRLKRSKKLDAVIVATTAGKVDNGIVGIAEKERVSYFRGSADNVLSRFYHAATENALDGIVRITADCPCIDPVLIDRLITAHRRRGADYTANNLKRTYPRGLDAEVFDFDVLKKTYESAGRDYEKEHVTEYIFRNPDRFNILSVEAPAKLRAPDIRITLDTEEDYALLCAVYDYLYPINKYFNAGDIVRLFMKKPWLKLINKKIVQKKVLTTLKDELEEAVRVLSLQGLQRAAKALRGKA